ncbi:MAG: AAA family ATPase [Ferruginibacter sp.]
MTNLIENISIDNFKSIRHCKITGCKRINLFIGGPGSGKSNVLEALSIFSLPFLRENPSKRISHFIRVEHGAELFYHGNYEQPVKIETNKGTGKITYDQNKGLEIILETPAGGGRYRVDDKLNFRFARNKEYLPFIRKYTFASKTHFKKAHSRYLIPPYGFNLPGTIERYPALKDEISNLFSEYELSLVIDKSGPSLKLMRPYKNTGDIFLLPYQSIGDALQRIIFFKAAMASNEDKVLLFEDPEVHSGLSSIAQITLEMIHKQDNQYFVSTHSPLMLNELLKSSREELSVFMFNYDRHQTRVRQLSDEELCGIDQKGI